MLFPGPVKFHLHVCVGVSAKRFLPQPLVVFRFGARGGHVCVGAVAEQMRCATGRLRVALLRALHFPL